MAPNSAVFAADIPRHSVGYSLGFEGKTEKLPNSQVLMLTTMCGHGMISSAAKKMIDWVKEGRRTPEQAVTYMARFCSAGVYNPSRAKRILEDAVPSEVVAGTINSSRLDDGIRRTLPKNGVGPTPLLLYGGHIHFSRCISLHKSPSPGYGRCASRISSKALRISICVLNGVRMESCERHR